MLPKAQQKDVVVVVAGRDATAVPKEDRGGRKGGGSWHGGDGRAACGCDCGGDTSRCVLKKGISWCLRVCGRVKVGSRKATTML